MSEVCCGQVWIGYRHSKCDRKAKFEVDGKWYCGIHNPNKAPTKAQIAAGKNYKARIKKLRLEMAAEDLLAELENCADILTTCFPNAPPDSCIGVAIINASAAIAKATGEQE